MHVIAERGNRSDGGDDILSEIARMRSRKPYAADSWDFSNTGKQFGESLPPCWIAIRIHVLSEQLNFRVAQMGHLAGFGEHRIRGPAALLAASEWNHAV